MVAKIKDMSAKKMTRDDFMAFYRDDELLNELSNDDRVEVFMGILAGNSDITKELLDELIGDYDGGSYDEHLQVVNHPEWTNEWPTEPGHYWFFGYPYGTSIINGDPHKPEWYHVTVREVSNGVIVIRDGHGWDPYDGAVGRFIKINLPEEPYLDVTS
jgi:hypothetical protein